MRPGAVIEVTDGVYAVLGSYDEAPGTRPAARRTHEHDAVRLLLRWLLIRVTSGVATTPVATRLSGQPYLPARPELGVSLSHSGRWLAAAVGVGRDVGVDVQEPEPAPATLLRRCCDPCTRAALTGLPPDRRDLEFAWIWAAQEACVKATGDGLAGRPWTIPVGLGQVHGAWGDVRWRSLRDRLATPVACAYRNREPAAVTT